MRNLLIYILLLLLLFLFTTSQNVKSQVVNQRIGFSTGAAEVGWNALENDSGYLMIGGTSPGIASIGIVQTDFDGNVLFQKTIMDTNKAYFSGYQGSLIKVSSGGYAMYGSTNSGAWASDLLYRFNDLGDTLWTKQLGDTAFQQVGSQVKETPDGGFICIGQNTKNSGQNWLVKTDSAGNIEWENWYGMGWERPTAIAVCADSGYICTGWTELGIGGPNKVNIRITKLDKLGNEQWTKIFGQADDDNAWSITQTQDGGYIFGGSITTTMDGRTKHYAIRLDPQGDTIWTRAYNPPTIANSPLTGFRTVIELPDGNFIAAGQEVTTDSAITIARHDGLVMKLKPNGDTLWHKIYRIPWMSGKQTSFEIKDIRPTSDGGFICGGVVYPSSPDTGTQDMWLMKIDSNGCVDTSNCVIVSSLNETSNLKHQTLSVYPNPSTGLFTLKLPELVTKGILTIFDYTGKQILQQPITQIATQIDVTRYPKGIYFYRVATKKELFTGKMVVN